MLSRSPSSVTLNSCSFSSGDSLDHCLSVKSLGYMPLRYRQQVSPHIPSMVPFASFWTRSKNVGKRARVDFFVAAQKLIECSFIVTISIQSHIFDNKFGGGNPVVFCRPRHPRLSTEELCCVSHIVRSELNTPDFAVVSSQFTPEPLLLFTLSLRILEFAEFSGQRRVFHLKNRSLHRRCRGYSGLTESSADPRADSRTTKG